MASSRMLTVFCCSWLLIIGAVRAATESLDANSTILQARLQARSHGQPPRGRDRVPVKVEVQIALLNIIEVSTSLETLELHGWLRQRWRDPGLQWDEHQWGVDSLTFKAGTIWQPDTRIYEQIEGHFPAMDTIVVPTGEAMLMTPFKTRVSCKMDLASYPFDTQNCGFTMGSWLYNNKKVLVQAYNVSPSFWEHPEHPERAADASVANRVPATAPLDLGHMQAMPESSEFDLTAARIVMKHSRFGRLDDEFSIIMFEFELTRGVTTLLFGLVLPIIFVTIVGLLSMLMPAPISGARPALSVTVMLTTATVYLVASRLTPQSNSTSIMSRLYMVAFTMNFVLVFLSILTTALNSIQPEDKLSQDRLIRVFEHFDLDKDGYLDYNESQRAMACVGIPRKEQLRIFKLFDEDGDQKIDLQEWRAIGEMTKKGEDLAMYHNYLVKGLVKFKMWQHEASKRRTAAAEKRKLEAEDAEERQLEAERHKDSFVTSLKFNARQALGLDPNHLTSVVHPGSSREDSVSEGEADSDTEADGAVAIPLSPATAMPAQLQESANPHQAWITPDGDGLQQEPHLEAPTKDHESDIMPDGYGLSEEEPSAHQGAKPRHISRPDSGARLKRKVRLVGKMALKMRHRVEASKLRKLDDVSTRASLSHVHSSAQKWGRHIAASIDFWGMVILPVLFGLYLIFEFGGVVVSWNQGTGTEWRALTSRANARKTISSVSQHILEMDLQSQHTQTARCYRSMRQFKDKSTPRQRLPHSNFEEQMGFKHCDMETNSLSDDW